MEITESRTKDDDIYETLNVPRGVKDRGDIPDMDEHNGHPLVAQYS